MFKKLALSILTAVFLLVSIAPYFSPARAQISGLPDTWYAPKFGTFVDRVYNDSNPEEIFGERYTHAQVVWILHSLSAILLPEFIVSCMTQDDPITAGQCFSEAWDTFMGGGSLTRSNSDPGLASIINSLTSSERLSGFGYIRNLAEKFHIISEAKAQGFGFENLAPIRSFWTAVRDISYFLLIVAFIVMAFMIMFRVRISPQTVITVQSALPRLIIILILITFSYAIAGFVVDLAYLSLGLVAILGNPLSDLSTLELFSELITTLPIITMFVIPIIAAYAFISQQSLSIILAIPLALAAALVTLLLFILLLIVALRVVWLMIKTFINVVLLIAAGPILILLGVLPAAGGFSSWLRNLISHIVIFPSIITMVFFAHYVFWSSIERGTWFGTFLETADSLVNINPFDIPLGTSSGAIELPGFNLGDSTVFGSIIAVGILFLIPTLGSIIQGILSGRPFAYGTAIGQAMGPLGWGYGQVTGSQEYRAMREAMAQERAMGWAGKEGWRAGLVDRIGSVSPRTKRLITGAAQRFIPRDKQS